jgi:hypothetical protein
MAHVQHCAAIEHLSQLFQCSIFALLAKSSCGVNHPFPADGDGCQGLGLSEAVNSPAAADYHSPRAISLASRAFIPGSIACRLAQRTGMSGPGSPAAAYSRRTHLADAFGRNF